MIHLCNERKYFYIFLNKSLSKVKTRPFLPTKVLFSTIFFIFFSLTNLLNTSRYSIFNLKLFVTIVGSIKKNHNYNIHVDTINTHGVAIILVDITRRFAFP